MAAINEITPERLRRLADTRADDDRVLSVYLNLDPAQFATADARSSEITSLLDDAHRAVENGARPHDALMDLRADLERIGEYLRSGSDWAQQAKAAAVFACSAVDLFETLRLDEPVTSEAVISSAPYLAPLVEVGVAGSYCVALIDGRWARILRGSAHDLREIVSFGDDVPSKPHVGGWSQANYQRSQFEDVKHHIKRAADVLHRMYRRRPFTALLIATPEERWPVIVESLHPEVRRRLGERLAIDVPHATLAEVNEVAGPAIEKLHAELENDRLAALRDALGTHGRACAGLADVLEALVERRVETLLYDAGVKQPGVSCPQCGWLGEAGVRCPIDDTPLERHDNVIEVADEAALRQSADVLVLRDRPDLGPLGSIAALTRF